MTEKDKTAEEQEAEPGGTVEEQQQQVAEGEGEWTSPVVTSGGIQESRLHDPTAPRGYGPEDEEERKQHDEEVQSEARTAVEQEQEEQSKS